MADSDCRRPFVWEHKWTIQNFVDVTEKVIESPQLLIEKNKNFGLVIELYPNGKNARMNNFISIFVKLQSCSKNMIDKVQLKSFTFALINKDGIIEERFAAKKSFNASFATVGDTIGWGNFIHRSTILNCAANLLPNGNLTFCCKLEFEEDYFDTMLSKPKLDRFRKFLNDQGKIFNNSKFSDISFLIDNTEIKAHKNILAARSTVLAAMFDSDMNEAAQNRVEISDIDYDIFMEFLLFLYTGSSEKVDQMAKQLLFVSDKYAVNELKDLCEEVLCKQLTTENSCEILALANLYSCTRLENQTLEFISSNLAEVLETEGLRAMEQNLLLKILKTSVKNCKCHK